MTATGIETNLLSLVIIVGSISGAFLRTMLPYIRALKDAEESGEDKPPFQKHYLFSGVFAIIISGIVAFTLFPSLYATALPDQSLTVVFFSAFLASWGANSIFNEVIASAARRTPTTTTTTTAGAVTTPTK